MAPAHPLAHFRFPAFWLSATSSFLPGPDLVCWGGESCVPLSHGWGGKVANSVHTAIAQHAGYQHQQH
uniref:Secreted protein n=1 Tax=Anguilla anguilla TaxID=7936 RepID=A0A0E9TEG3_ANGAN